MLQQLWNGLTIGALYGLVGMGYTLLFGVLQLIFFAQGELLMLGAFAGLGMLALSAGGHLPPTVLGALVVAAGIATAVGMGVFAERVTLRPLRSAPRVLALITSMGASIVLQNVILVSIGPQTIPFPSIFPTTAWEVAGVRFSLLELVLIGLVVALAAGIRLFLHRSPTGYAIRAIAQNRDGARLMGIRVDSTIMATFVISSVLAALAGLLMASYYHVVRFDMGFVPGIKGFTVAILGGVGRVEGALIAGVFIGVAEALFAGYISSDYRDLFVFGLLVLTLLLRPQGLLGERV